MVHLTHFAKFTKNVSSASSVVSAFTFIGFDFIVIPDAKFSVPLLISKSKFDVFAVPLTVALFGGMIGVITREQDWNQIDVSGHADGLQIKRVIDGSNSKRFIPIHTVHEEYHKKWHKNVKSVNPSDLVSL